MLRPCALSAQGRKGCLPLERWHSLLRLLKSEVPGWPLERLVALGVTRPFGEAAAKQTGQHQSEQDTARLAAKNAICCLPKTKIDDNR